MVQDSAAKAGYAQDTQKVLANAPAGASRGIDLITGPEGELVGFAVSQVAQLYTTVDRIIMSQRILSLPIADRFALAGKVAACPDEQGRLIEKLASSVATSMTEAGALNALYLLDLSKELVPGFKEKIPEGRVEKAAELSPHKRAQAFVLLGEKPSEWAQQKNGTTQVMLLPQGLDEDDDLISGAGRAIGDATKFVGGAALGGVGLVTDTLGLTKGAEDELAEGAEDAVDIVGHGVTTVVDTVGEGLDSTADDLAEKGVVNAVADGAADAVDLVQDFVTDSVLGIADGVQDMLQWVSGEEQSSNKYETHKVAIVVAELFGEERSLGLRIENRVVTNFTKPEAARLGWRLGDCILGVNMQHTSSQEAMLACIGTAKEELRTKGAPVRFLVERMGARP
eukprot:CAMPEP_0197659774 /NCGR_PEP_ID=MMETSP1338-20131121/49016_1 /TAXON_ID=43686 ORGANISM="Pelagodinium beii, Strain RCC1491" /NCGR_SAMPLE_ID=MMETSP1338 /ASSEMBLY_ACC=CAM_ASM_000754 /LENGTH=395 /DNA_ID=CAMNT_0043236863 /DNA_START=51 /DNA_END=1238 /DNA_ORIENTATION=+